MEYLAALIVALLGALVYTNTKKKTAEARNENLETKEEVLKVEKESQVNKAKLEVEKEKTKELENQLKEHEKLDETTKEVLDFFNNFTNKDK